MKKGLSRLTFSETTRRIITIAIYAFFTIYTLYSCLRNQARKASYAMVCF